MSETVLVVLITSMGGTFLTVLGAIIQQIMAAKNQILEHKKTQVAAEETRHENQVGFNDLKAIFVIQEKIIDLILCDRLRYLLKSYQDKTEVAYADKEIIVEMYAVYQQRGHNGTIKTMFEIFDKLPVR